MPLRVVTLSCCKGEKNGKNKSKSIDNFNQLTPYAVGFERQFNRSTTKLCRK